MIVGRAETEYLLTSMAGCAFESSVDAFSWCFEMDELLTCLGLAPQPDRPPDQSPSLRLAVFIDHLLDARNPFRPLSPLGTHHSTSVPRTRAAHCSRLHSPSHLGALLGLQNRNVY